MDRLKGNPRLDAEIARYKQQAARRAVESVTSGMVVGLGYGSTAAFAVQEVADQIHAGRLKNITAILCSAEMEPRARRLGIPLTSLDVQPVIDLTIDGADEVDPRLNLIKGGGGAIGTVETVEYPDGRRLDIVYSTDPEGNIVEILKWTNV
jgi:ribose 5-phosphate isomerase A